MNKKFNRGWVKNAAIIFLVVLLLLTFFSNTILNISLPEVVTAQPTSGTITNAIRGNTVAEAAGSYSIILDYSARVLAVYVREGDLVEQGQRLFTLEAGENELEAQLNTLRLNYQKMLLDMTGSDYAMQNELIRQAREDLERAIRDRNALGQANMTEGEAQAALDRVQTQLNTYQGRVTALETELSYIDDFDPRSEHIGAQVLAYTQALSTFLIEMGMSYADYVAQNPGASNQWTQAVETARAAMVQAAATARTTVVANISEQSANVVRAQTAVTTAENNLIRIQHIVAADDKVRTLQRALNAALITLSSEQQQDSLAHQRQLLDLQALEEEIADLEARIRRQGGETEGDETTISALHAGTVTGLTATAGQDAEAGLPLARIEVADMGFVAEISIDARQAQEVRPGVTVDVDTLWWGPGLSGRVTGVRMDPDDPTNRRLVTVEILGEVTVGEQLSVSIPLSSAQYQTIVPRSAVAQDATGHHVYVLQSRSSPLGTRYTAVRVDVTVEAEDDTRAAIRGDVDRFANVIIRSSAPLGDRDRVRLATD